MRILSMAGCARARETMSRDVGRTLSWPGSRSVSLGDLCSSEKIGGCTELVSDLFLSRGNSKLDPMIVAKLTRFYPFTCERKAVV